MVNDCAERGVKLTSDFVAVARKEQHLQNVLQAVEHDRNQQPNLRRCKRKLFCCSVLQTLAETEQLSLKFSQCQLLPLGLLVASELATREDCPFKCVSIALVFNKSQLNFICVSDIHHCCTKFRVRLREHVPLTPFI